MIETQDRVELLSAISRQVEQGNDLPRLLDFVLGCTVQAVGARRVGLVLGRGGVLDFVTGADENGRTLDCAWPHLCWQSANSAFTSRSLATSQDGSTVAVPVGNPMVGCLVLDVSRWTPDCETLVQGIASQLGMALHMARLRAQETDAQRREHAFQLRCQNLSQQVSDLERRNHELWQFVHHASHDLREPLRTASGYSQLLSEHLKRSNDEQVLQYIDRIRNATARMTTLLQDLLEYAQINERPRARQPVNSADVFNHARSDLAQAIKEARANLVRGELPWIEGDPVGLRLLFKALLSNAIKFRRGSHPTIEVGSQHLDERTVRFFFRDDGVGIRPDYLDKVFEPFRRLHTLDEFPGSGLGLSLARRIVEREGGRIWIEPNKGFGVTVYLELHK